MKKKFLCGLAFLLFPVLLFAQNDEKMSVATYYPSPYGVYKTLRLYPRTEIAPGTTCPNAGEMIFNENDKKVYFCDGNIWTVLGPVPQEEPSGNCRLQEYNRKLTTQEILDWKCPGVCYWYENTLTGKKYYTGVLLGASSNPAAQVVTCFSYYPSRLYDPNRTGKVYYSRCD